MAGFRMYLRDATGRVVAREDVEVGTIAEAAEIAAILCAACSDTSAYYEVWDGQSLAPEAGLPEKLPRPQELARRTQEIVLDREIALRDSQWHIAESRQLLKRIGEWCEGMQLPRESVSVPAKTTETGGPQLR